jgi:hypothetical protein
MIGLFLFVVSFVIVAPGAHAQLVTDRPDFVESSRVVGVGVVQLEMGGTFTDVEPGLEVWATPTLVRFGLSSRLEFRAESMLLSYKSLSRGEGKIGVSDIALGAKVHLQDASGGRPSSGLLLHVALPTGSAVYRGKGARPSLRVSSEWELPADFSFSVMPGVAMDHDGEKRFASGILGVVVGWGWTDDLRSFGEVALPQIASDEYGGVLATFNTGATLLLSPDHQMDMGVSLPLTDGADDIVLGLGFSVRVGA